MYRTSSFRREIGMRSGPYTGGAVLLPWDAIDLRVRRKLLRAHAIAAENRRADTRRMLAIAAACGLVLVIASGSGFGQLFHPALVEGRWFVVLYGALLAGVLVPSAWLARRIFSHGSWLPFERALLRLDAVEATPKGLIVRPFGDARLASMSGSHVDITYADTSTFRIRTAPGGIEGEMLEAEATLERASLTTDEAYRAGVDPFHELRGDKGLRAHPRALPIDMTARRKRMDVAIAGALVLASFVLGGLVLDLRNRLSDDAAFEYARSRESEELYDAYLEAASRHRSEVRDVLVPRVVLNDAERHGANDLAGYLARFPNSAFDAEARAALSRACREEGATYLWAGRTDRNRIDTVLADFKRDHAACGAYGGEAVTAYFEARRREIRDRPGLQPALRDVLLGLVDEAEHGRPAVLYIIHRADPWSFGFARELDALTGGVNAVYAQTPPDTTSLAIDEDTAICPTGRARGDAFAAHFTLIVKGEKKADWTRVVLHERSLFEAATGAPSDVDPCVHVMP